VRTDLSVEDVKRLRAGNILYDREGAAEYFQAYTKTMEGGLFFEIVQRRNYQGYGAINAPIRLASQTHLASVSAPLAL
jgi:4-hydroxyphenylpyruvate dioxygenase